MLTSANDVAKETIIDLLEKALKLTDVFDTIENVREQEKVMRQVGSYFNAATNILLAHAEIYNELVEHPLFIQMSRFLRK